jgi:hypothetical protein
LFFEAGPFNLNFGGAAMPTDTKANPFKPAQPHIPGVPDASTETKPQGPPRKSAFPTPAYRTTPRVPVSPETRPVPVFQLGLLAGIIMAIIIVGFIWRAYNGSGEPTHSAPVVADSAPAADERDNRAGKLPVAPGEIATATELAKPWSSKRFVFRDRFSTENVEAIAVRLPGGSLWGISLREPYGTCDLQYVTDLAFLRAQYGFAAGHPMVVNSCTGAVYDLERYGSGPNGLVRGEVVHGAAVRPPIGIEVIQRGDKIIATRME